MNISQQKCRYCYKEIENMVKKKIIFRGRNRFTGKAEVKEEVMEFCSDKCASHMQMSMEG